ncbi:tetratricopeptide repeat protein [Spirosoma sp. KCTC 42546]|uniref:tetratricopeptide repeat-containing sensor histidine kinase n=1 Tax=Spirosoma sp. KCTC 42546 TaxID=2520506 RepID=UPI00115B09C7|nr:tetratricopeptide repeat protein [Spirosoma sp. KCTC 42546]QDK80385.1 tetratricopeptide repeat protein [Spirosoma sp. KCTC 42546]
MIKSLLVFIVVLSVCTLPTFSQLVPSPTDTSYVMELLKKGEVIETNQSKVALTNYQKAYEFSKKINYTKGYFESVRLMAYLLNNLGRHDEARKIAQDALQKAKQDTSKRNLGLSYFALANTALFSGQLSEAIPNYQQAAHYMRLIGKLKNVAVINQNLGYIYEQQKMYSQALDQYKRALSFDINDKKDRRSIAIDYFSMANLLSKQNKLKESQAYYLKAKQWIEQTNDLDFMINLYNNIGYQYSAEARYDSALYYQGEALRMSRQLGNPRHELHMLMSLAQTHNRMKQFAQAKTLLDKSNQIATKNEVGLAEFRNIYREYAVANEGLHQYKATAEWLDKYIGTNDSLNNQETKELLQNYELQLKQAEGRQKLAEKQRQIDQLELARQQQNFWLLLAGLLIISIVGGGIFGYLYYQQRQRSAENALLAAERERELALVQSELQGQQKERLRISKEMHDDLGASLTAIGLLSEVVKTRMGPNTTPEVEKISSISADMVTTMNEIIWSLNTKNDSLNGLIAYTRAYASEFIENTDLMLQTEVEESPSEITMRGIDRRNVFLTVKEALNNVVKHAQASRVILRMQPDDKQLLIEVCDNGRGFTPNAKSNLRNGLSNMQNRMAESGGRCEIVPSETGTCVKICYPYPIVPAEKILQT